MSIKKQETSSNNKTAHLGISSVTNCPDYTIVWNVVDYLKGREFITDETKKEVWNALEKLEKEKRCTLGELPTDVY